MQIANRIIGPGEKPFIIAEVAQTHDGSLGTALAFIDVASECGADAIKFQTHIASEESTPNEPWRVKFSHQDVSRFDYWRRMEFTLEQWRILKAHADARGIIFLSSPFSVKACEWLESLEMPAWKVASGEVHNAQLLDWMAATGKPMILSSGLSSTEQTRNVVEDLLGRGVDLAVLHCTTRYPTPAEEVGMNLFQLFHQHFANIPVGLSDHSGEIYPGVVAAYQGASIIEVHLTLHPKMFGPDVSSSLTPEQLTQLIKGCEFTWKMRQHAVDKEQQLGHLSKERNIFGRSLVAVGNLPAGTKLVESHFAYKKPGGGIAYEDRSSLIGKTLAVDVMQDQILRIEDVR